MSVNRLHSTQVARPVTAKVDLSDRKSDRKTLNPFTQLTQFSGLMNLTTERTCPLFRDSDRFKLKSLELA